jgi:probable phosphoglycerate mutase
MHRTSSSAGTESAARPEALRRKFYFVRHGETDWNAERRLQGRRDIPLNALGRRQAARSGELLANLLAIGGATPQQFAFTASPLSRARETMEIMRAELGVPPQDYTVDVRLRSVLATRERDKWNFQPPGGESYAQLLVRVREWHDGMTGDTIIAAHGGVARALLVLYAVKSPAEAPLGDVAQGVVYEFAPGSVNRYG